MQKFVERTMHLTFKSQLRTTTLKSYQQVIGIPTLSEEQLLEKDTQFFEEYDKVFLNSQYIQSCLQSGQLRIPIDFSKQSRYDEFAEDHGDEI